MIISVKGLRKSFKKQIVLDDIDFNVAEGSIFSLLGANGAGKTTTVHILSTLIRKDGGAVNIAGINLDHNPEAVRSIISVTGQFSAVDNVLTGEENMLLMAKLRHLNRRDGQRRSTELLERFDLAEAAKKPVSTYSGGMRRKLDLAMSLMGDPRIVFLDEPTTGLDPRSRQMMWGLIRDLANRGVTLFLTTQYLEEADQLAHRIAVLHKGQIAAEGTPTELKRRLSGGHVQLEFADEDGLEKAQRLLSITAKDETAFTMRVPTNGSVTALRELLERLDAASIAVAGVSVHTPDLDDVFFALTSETNLKEVVS
ncbi:MAG: ATP-binding cassette domain-containing protein [Anaerolineae bacterium]